ncbi:MAG: F0F1 ATP synthase subunit gamma [Collinsella sp.]
MANLRDIKKRISSVTTTKQITRTMEMVSTAKIRRALDRSKQAEPYKEALTDVMLTVAGDASCSGTDPMLQRHETVKRGLIVVIASDRGLAGGFNTTVERTAEKALLGRTTASSARSSRVGANRPRISVTAQTSSCTLRATPLSPISIRPA